MQNKGKLANNIFFLSLLCIFVICSVLVVSYQIIGYRSIVNNNERVSAKHTPYAYLSNKIRANDTKNAIYIKHIDNQDVLVLESESQKTKTYIYMYQNKLRELQGASDYDIDLSDGDALFDIKDFNIKKEGNKLTIMLNVDNTSKTLILTLHSEGASL